MLNDASEVMISTFSIWYLRLDIEVKASLILSNVAEELLYFFLFCMISNENLYSVLISRIFSDCKS